MWFNRDFFVLQWKNLVFHLHWHFRSSRFVSSSIKFPLIISTLLLQCPFIIADIATISCCVPHNKQVCYQLLVQQEWTPCLLLTPLPFLAQNTAFNILICHFRTTSSFFKVIISGSILFIFVHTSNNATSFLDCTFALPLVSFLFFSFTREVIFSILSPSAAHARRTLFHLALNSF